MVMPAQPQTPVQQTLADELRQLWQRRRLLLTSLLLVAAVLLLYAPITANRFINYDDNLYITANPHVTRGLTPANIVWAFRTFEMGHWHPLTWLSHMLDYQLFGANPAGHHYMSALLHTACAVLIFLLLHAATGSLWRGLLVAALFAAHPLNVENVAWASERKTVLCALFTLLALGAYGWYRRRPSAVRYLLLCLLFVLSLMAKAMSVTLPVLLLLLDLWPLDATAGRWWPPLRRWLEKLPLLAISLIFSVLAMRAEHVAGPTSGFALHERLANVAVDYWAYIGKMFWPARLSILYSSPGSHAALPVAVAALILLAVTALCLRLRRAYPWLIAGWLWYLVSLLPVIGLAGSQSIADRYAYTPLLGLFVIIAWGGDELRRRLQLPSAAGGAVALCVLAALSLCTRATLAHWKDSLTLLTHAAQIAPQPDAVIETNLGEAYLALGNDDEAMRHFLLASALAPSNGLPHYDIGTTLLHQGHAAESLPELEFAVNNPPSSQMLLYAEDNLGSAYLMLGDYAPAELHFRRALALNPEAPPALLGLGQVLHHGARYAEAEQCYLRAIALQPAPAYFFALGRSYEAEGNATAALQAYRQALSRNPDFTAAGERIRALTGAR
jgi:tetratricopeptide (TPR) repeat protein